MEWSATAPCSAGKVRRREVSAHLPSMLDLPTARVSHLSDSDSSWRTYRTGGAAGTAALLPDSFEVGGAPPPTRPRGDE